MPLRLIIEDFEGATTVVALGEAPVTIGRETDNTICLDDRNVSRKHARLVPRDDGWSLEDLHSYNGVRINGEVIEGASILHDGDLIQIGDYQLQLGDEAATRATMELGPGLLAAANDQLGGADSPGAGGSVHDTVDEGPQSAGAMAGAAAMTPALEAAYDEVDDYKPGGGAGKAIVVLLLLGALGAGAWWLMNRDTPQKAAANEAAVAVESGQPTGAAVPTGDADAQAEGELAVAEGSEGVADAGAENPEAAEGALEEEAGAVEDEALSDGGELVEDADAGAELPTPEPEPAVAPTPTKKKKRKKKAVAPAEPTASASELLSDARKAQLAGSYKTAYSLAKKSHAAGGGADAAQVMGVAACKMGDASKAKSAYSKLSGSKKSALKGVCAKAGIDL